jgi:V/A-type H+-transporting ATPase subunit I
MTSSRWRELAEPVRMQRVALVAPAGAVREVLALVGEAGVLELDAPTQPGTTEDTSLDAVAGRTVVRGEVAALTGWVPVSELAPLRRRLDAMGAAAVPITAPRGTDPPTLLREGGGLRRSFTPLVQTYGTVPYEDVDPSVVAGLAYIAMFAMMFGDAGHGALLAALGLLVRSGRVRRLAPIRRLWPFVAGAGLAAMVFGLLYGECFGPTGLVPVLWLAPLDHPVMLLVVGVAVGAVLLALAQAIATVNRWREGGWSRAVSAPSGVAGAALLAGVGLVAGGVWRGLSWLVVLGGVVVATGVVLAFVGFLASSGGGGSGITQAVVEVFDAVLRVGTNLVSFARLAAFGMTHAALGLVVWDGTTSLASSGPAMVVAAVVLFVLGNALTFGLEALVAGIQALRLEYYELFSRLFEGEGRPFRPWRVSPAPSDQGRRP